jgi:hypothetical protein
LVRDWCLFCMKPWRITEYFVCRVNILVNKIFSISRQILRCSKRISVFINFTVSSNYSFLKQMVQGPSAHVGLHERRRSSHTDSYWVHIEVLTRSWAQLTTVGTVDITLYFYRAGIWSLRKSSTKQTHTQILNVLAQLQMGTKVTSLVARYSGGRCARNLRPIRGCDAHPAWIWRICHANVTRKFAYDVRHATIVTFNWNLVSINMKNR